MAPSIHPPCAPSASCTPIRCHPTPPPCKNPEKCLKKTISKGIRPCQSAVSIMATRSKAKCGNCGKCKGCKNKKDPVQKFLKRKSKENRMKKKDRLTGSHSYLKYTRKKGSKRKSSDCCAGHGHRGRLKRGCCEIL